MKINGTDIKIKLDFKPETKLSLIWVQLSNGNWVCTDRGVSNDTYDTSIRIYGTEATVNAFIALVETARTSGGNILTLTEFNSQEHIYGADLDYTGSITATVYMDRRAQKTWKGFEVTLKLSCLSPSFTGGVGSLPILRHLEIGFDADSDYTIHKFDSYQRNFNYIDSNSDIGTFTGNFIFDDAEMIQLRRYVANQRGATVSIPYIFGVTKPFGRRSGSYPYDVKILTLEDMGMLIDLNLGKPKWRARITFGEVV
jgi:hypothetical protein